MNLQVKHPDLNEAQTSSVRHPTPRLSDHETIQVTIVALSPDSQAPTPTPKIFKVETSHTMSPYSIYIYIYMYMQVYICIYIYTYVCALYK